MAELTRRSKVGINQLFQLMKNIDLSKVFQNYRGLWVALTDSNTVISADKSARKTLEEANKKGYPKPTLFKVPRENNAYIG